MPNRRTVSLTAAAAALTLVAVGAAAPANADPWKPGFRTYAGVGSVVTATMWDVLTNGRANIAGGSVTVPSVASFDPVGSATIQTKATVAPIPRPRSGAGIDALMESPSQVDFARVANRPLHEAGIADDRITYLPVARDAVSVVGFGLGYDVQNLTREELTAIYSCTASGTISVSGAGTGARVTYSSGSVTRQLRPVLPAGTGDVRAFFLRAIGVESPGACVLTSPAFDENDARVLTLDGQIVPFLVSSWIAQKNNMLSPRTMNDYDHTILSINGERPVANTADPAIPPLMPGPLYGRSAYPPGTQRGVFARDVYNVVRSSDLGTPLVATLTTGLGTPTARMVLNRTGFKNLDYLGQPNRYLGGPYPVE